MASMLIPPTSPSIIKLTFSWLFCYSSKLFLLPKCFPHDDLTLFLPFSKLNSVIQITILMFITASFILPYCFLKVFSKIWLTEVLCLFVCFFPSILEW